jgi:predicted deacylase
LVTVYDSVGKRLAVNKASVDGVVIGHIQQPLVNQGDAVVHLARIDGAPSRSSKDFT